MAAKKKEKQKKPLVASDMVWDWKESPTVEDLQAALEPFGIVVTDHPACEGSDAYGVIFSNRPLTKKELKEAKGVF